MTDTMTEQCMSPVTFAPFDGMPGCMAAARDADMRLLWCNEEYLQRHTINGESPIGKDLHWVFSSDLADERTTLMRPAIDEHRIVTYVQFSHGHRWLTRVWPLDPDAFGVTGCFLVLKQLTDPLPSRPGHMSGVQFARIGHLGDLSGLTPRELEVYYYLATGMTVAEIASMLHRSPKTEM